MKKTEGFWVSLEEYTWKVVERSPLPQYWRWVGIGLVLVVVVSSSVGAKSSVTGAASLEAVVEKAAGRGDYSLAQQLWNRSMSSLEDKVYPERKVERRIAELEAKLEEYPGNRQIYIALTELYAQIGHLEQADEYREKARILDPND